MSFYFVFCLLLGLNVLIQANHLTNANDTGSLTRDDTSLATAVVNPEIIAIVDYQNTQVYVYGAVSNEKENRLTPQKWIFYYVPIMVPTQNCLNDSWIWPAHNEIRLKLLLGNPTTQELARKAIADKYDLNTSQYSKYWTVAPLMIDSLMAFIVSGTASPVIGVHPYQAVHPNSLTMTFRFQCSNEDTAKFVIQKIVNGDYEIVIAFYFTGFKQITTNFVSITSEQLKNVLSKTIADGGSTNAQYIHRNQASKFIGNYIANVKKMIYMENINVNTTSLTDGLEKQFISLLQQGMNVTQQIALDAALFDQIWSPSDLNPDRLTSELSKIVTYNDTESKRHNYTNKYFDLNKQNLQTPSNNNSTNGGASASFLGISLAGLGSSSLSSSNSFHDILMQTNHHILSLSEIERLISQQQTEFQWTDRLQVAIISKQLTADKTNGAIIRTISMLNMPVDCTNNSCSVLLHGSIILWSGKVDTIPRGWAICNGTNGTPDLRDKFVIGSDSSARNRPHSTGGSSAVTPSITVYGTALNEAQMPSHNHGGYTAGEDAVQIYYDAHTSVDTRVMASGGNRWFAARVVDSCPHCQHTHKIQTSGQNKTHTHTATSSTIDIHPPFYALIYIMKL